jgi:cytochrome c oxidase assembly factor CtaG
MKILAGILGGLILAILGAMLVTVTFAATKNGSGIGVAAFFVMWVAGIIIALTAPAAAKAWRRLFLSSAVLSFLLPLSGLIYTGSYVASMDSTAEHATAAAAGAAIGGTLVSGFMGFVGFFLGIVFLILGLLVGRDKQIVYIERPSGAKAETST